MTSYKLLLFSLLLAHLGRKDSFIAAADDVDVDNDRHQTSSPGPTESPNGFQPTSSFPSSGSNSSSFCSNTPGWAYDGNLDCENALLLCEFAGAREHCCRCKSATISAGDDSNILQEHSDNSAEERYKPAHIISSLLFGLIVFCALWLLVSANSSHEAQLQEVRLRLQQEDSEAVEQRMEQIKQHFHFRTVLPNKSNLDPESLRGTNDAVDEDINQQETSSDDRDHDHDPTKNMPPHAGSTSSFSLGNVWSAWRQSSSRDECSICLDTYNEGEVVCISKKSECPHVFHQKCVAEWLKEHDCCPLCRKDLMN